MRALSIYLVGLALIFGMLALLIVGMSGGSGRVFVVVDSSFPMRQVWAQVPGALDDIESQGYAAYALATEKAHIHTWQEALVFRGDSPFAPCDLSEIDAYPEASEADERALITTSESCPTDELTDWRVIVLRPPGQSQTE